MKRDKKYIKFYEKGNNRYYLLQFDDELHIATESFLTLKKTIFGSKDLVQYFKLLELTAPLSILLQEVINMPIKKEDKEFPDMTTYRKFNNIALRKAIEGTYKDVLDAKIKKLKHEFTRWKKQFVEQNCEKMTADEMNKIIENNEKILDKNLKIIKDESPLKSLSFTWKTNKNTIISSALTENLEFLYTQKIGSNYTISYLYDLDEFGTISIYKIHIVKDVIKNIETFIYDRDIINNMITFMANNKI